MIMKWQSELFPVAIFCVVWYNEFNKVEFSDINSWRNLRYTLRCDILLRNAICACGTRKGIYYELASNKVLRNIEIFDFVIFREVLISYRNRTERGYIAFEERENISHERERVYR